MLRKKKNAFAAKEEEEKKDGGENAHAMKKVVCPAELRLRTEFAEIDLPAHASLNFPDETTQMKFDVKINLTKEDCMWKGGVYHFTLTSPYNYPHEAPKAHCNTPIYHPNIDTAGNVCLNILRADWKPILGVNSVILGLIFLFIEPNPNDPLNHEAAEELRSNKTRF